MVTDTFKLVTEGHTVGLGLDVVTYCKGYKPVFNPAGTKKLLLTPTPVQVPFTALCTMFMRLKAGLVTHKLGTEAVKAEVLNCDT